MGICQGREPTRKDAAQKKYNKENLKSGSSTAPSNESSKPHPHADKGDNKKNTQSSPYTVDKNQVITENIEG